MSDTFTGSDLWLPHLRPYWDDAAAGRLRPGEFSASLGVLADHLEEAGDPRHQILRRGQAERGSPDAALRSGAYGRLERHAPYRGGPDPSSGRALARLADGSTVTAAIDPKRFGDRVAVYWSIRNPDPAFPFPGVGAVNAAGWFHPTEAADLFDALAPHGAAHMSDWLDHHFPPADRHRYAAAYGAAARLARRRPTGGNLFADHPADRPPPQPVEDLTDFDTNRVTGPADSPFREKVRGPKTRAAAEAHLARAVAGEPGTLVTLPELVSAAQAGSVNAGQYRRSFAAVRDLLGDEDAHHWAALNAVLSSQCPWKEHTLGAFRLLRMWDEAGRPADETSLEELMHEFHNVRGPSPGVDKKGKPLPGPRLYSLMDTGYSKTTGKRVNAKYWKSIRILQAAATGATDPAVLRGLVATGGFGKTPEFYTAFHSPSGVPLDTWMSQALVPAEWIHEIRRRVPADLREAADLPTKGPADPAAYRRLVEAITARPDAGGAGKKSWSSRLKAAQVSVVNKPAVYTAYAALIHHAADVLRWHPNEVQEAAWTTLAAISGLRDTGLHPAHILGELRHPDLRKAWDMLALLTTDPDARAELERFGVRPADIDRAAHRHGDRGVPLGLPADLVTDHGAFRDLARRVAPSPENDTTAARPIVAAWRERQRRGIATHYARGRAIPPHPAAAAFLPVLRLLFSLYEAAP